MRLWTTPEGHGEAMEDVITDGAEAGKSKKKARKEKKDKERFKPY